MILAGPFRAGGAIAEYLVAPLLTGSEEAFSWTSEDVRLTEDETGGSVRFAAIWNARPILAADLGIQLFLLPAEATTAVRDAYWAALNDEPSRKNSRLGRPIKSADEPVARFHEDELARWQPLSGRVLTAGETRF